MRIHRPRAVAGISLFEMVVVLALSALVFPAFWTTVSRHRTASGRVADRAQLLEGVRVLSWLVPHELAMGTEGEDWDASSDTLALRAFRGFGVVDSIGSGTREAYVCFVGDRAPDPGKDSVLVLDRSGRWFGADLLYSQNLDTACRGDGETGEEARWSLSAEVSQAVVLRNFERGSYHLAGGTLRYRRGDGGRQPVTSGFLENGRFLPSSGGRGGLGWEVTLLSTPPASASLTPPSPSDSWRGRIP